MIRKEQYMIRTDSTILYRTYSDADMMIQKDGTDIRYDEAIDVEGSTNTYTETDIPIETATQLTITDTLTMLNELGVDTDD